jgi:ribose transport system permease protein
VQGLEYVTGVQWLNDMFNGVALILAVAFALWRQNAAARPGRRPPQAEEVTVAEDRSVTGSTG